MRARAEIETGSTHDKIVVTEIPYGVNKAELDVYKRQVKKSGTIPSSESVTYTWLQ